jgi:hypothetical protein
MKSKKSWQEKLQQPKEAKVVVLEKPWGGMAAGDSMYISTPQEVDSVVRQLPPGKLTPVADFRLLLAEMHGCAGTCHLTTSIFLRISAEAAREALLEGDAIENVTPFWRVIAPGSPLAQKMELSDTWLAERLAEERVNAGM